MKKQNPYSAALFFLIFLLSFTQLFSQNIAPTFHFIVLKKDGIEQKRVGTFIPTLQEPGKRNIDPRDPGASAHLTVLIKDNVLISGSTDSLNKLINTPGSFVYLFENTDWDDSTRFLPLIRDSTTADNFLAQVRKVKKREWTLYRIVIQPRYFNRAKGISYAMYLRYQVNVFTVDIPNKSNRENLRMKSISPSIPLIHLGNYDSTQYNLGPGISFNFGLAPCRPLLRLAADFLGPVSIEWMIHPIHNVNDALAIHGTALGLFFNSGYGIFHWGIAFYTPKFSRAEAYIGINLVPAMQVWNSRGKQRYRW
ncbi:MAG TPA: hypothetical protein VFJ43_05410 [Bacteroidia bacterium]|nr:hypothetical protein [Bacteroidia bacterium]